MNTHRTNRRTLKTLLSIACALLPSLAPSALAA